MRRIFATIVYYGSRFLINLVALTWLRIEVEGLENIPRKGAVILAAKHSSGMDILVLGVLTWRWVHYVAKKSLLKNRIFAWWMKQVQAIPISQKHADTEATRRVVDVLQHGGVIGLFPEGTRGDPVVVGEIPSLFALMAAKGAPCEIVVIGIAYKKSPWPWAVRVVCSAPIAVRSNIDSHDEQRALASLVKVSLQLVQNDAVEALK